MTTGRTLKEKRYQSFISSQTKNFKSASTDRKCPGIGALNMKMTVLKQIEVSFMDDVCFSKNNFSFNLNIFGIELHVANKGMDSYR